MGEKRSKEERRSVEVAPTVASDGKRSVEVAPTVASEGKRSVEVAPTVASDSKRSMEEAPTLAADSQRSVEEAPTLAADSQGVEAAAATATDTDAGQSVGYGATVADAGERGPAPLPRVARGDAFDQFLVLDEIGRGGMGVVVAAHDPELDRKVAIKILRPGVGGTQQAENASARLRREAQAMAKLAHPNVITVHQVGTRGKEIYVVMEFVAGGTLREWTKKEQRTWREVLETYLSAGRGLAAAHKAGLVHRDFKPDNVLIDEEGRVRVTDFGLVGRIGEEEPDPEDTLKDFSSQASPSDIRKALTRPGQIMGTPYYMAPEQHKGAKTDERADQFAFCVSLYEALYGQRPFAGDTYEEVAYNAIFEPPAEPPADSAVPSRIHAILLRGMSKRPADRYPDMDALLDELSVDPMAARRRMMLLGAAAAVLLAGAGALYALWPEREGAEARCDRAAHSIDEVWNADRRAALATAFADSGFANAKTAAESLLDNFDEYAAAMAQARRQACAATYVRGEQSDELYDKRMYCLDRLQANLSAAVKRFEHGIAAEQVGSAVHISAVLTSPDQCSDIEAWAEAVPLPSEPETREKLETWMEGCGDAEVRFDLGEYAEGLLLARRRAEEAETFDYAPAVADAQYVLGRYLYATGDLDGAETALRAAIKAAADAKAFYAEANAWLSLIYVVGHLQGRAQEGLGLAEAARAALARIEPESVLHANLLNVEGLVLLSEGKYAEGAEKLEKALRRFVEVRGPDHLDVAVARNNLANALQNLGRYEEARAQLDQVIAVRTKALGPDHPDMATALNDLGLVAFGEGKYDEAQKHLERAVEIRLSALGEAHSRTADALNNLAMNLEAQGRYAEALATYRRSLAILEKLRGPNHVDLAPVLGNMGDALLATGEQRPAWEAYARALAIVEYVRGKDDVQVTPYVEKLASMLQQMGIHDQALQFYERSLSLREKAFGVTDYRVAQTLQNRASVYLDSERYEEALADFDRARYIFVQYRGEGHPDVAEVDYNLGVTREREGKLDLATERYEKALAAFETRFGKDSPRLVEPLRGLGDVAHAKADYTTADAQFSRIVSIREGASGADSPALADPLTWRGTNLMAARDWARARDVLSRAFELRAKGGEDAALTALNQFLLAQATWGAGKRAEARRLASEARRAFVGAGDRVKGNVEEVDAWLRTHR